jgi:spore germination protein YaaH/flagellar hook assembly protein FlgD
VAAAAPPAPPAAPPAPSADASAGGLAAGIHWQEAEAHARDRIAFAPGGRVTVGFKPRADDRWAVGGVSPRALPAGRLDGARMRRSVEASAADRAAARSSEVLDARGAAWSPSPEPETVAPQARVQAGGLRREVFGFLPYWQVSSSSLRIQYDKISTIAYFGVGAAADGSLQKRNSDGSTTVGWSGWTSSRLTSIINRAHSTGTRVVLTVQSFAWNSTGRARQKALLASATARSRLARQVALAVRDRGADGVNLDFEPLAGSASQFTALVRTVRSELNKISRGYQLTFDTTGFIGNYPIEAATASGGADAIFIMGYDYRGASSSPVGSIAPLSRSGYDIRETVAAYAARVPPSKLILGVPYYGRAWSTATSGVHARNISGARYGSSVTVTYTNALPFLSRHGRRYDTTEAVAWTVYRRQNCTSTYGCVNPWRQLYVDDSRAIRAKYDLINRYNLRGAGIWALGYDGTRTELWSAIRSKFIADTVPPTIRSLSVTAAAFSPNGDGAVDRTSARMTVTGHITWGYRVQAVTRAGLGRPLRSGTRTTQPTVFTWNGFNASGSIVPDGTYRITLWAEDASANRAERSIDVRVDTSRAAISSSSGRGFVTPDGDGKADTLSLRWSASEPLTGYMSVRDVRGTSIRAWGLGGRTSGVAAWDGRARNGLIVSDGRYILRVEGRDRGGNRSVSDRRILVDRTILSVVWNDGSFDPRAGATSRAFIRLRRPAVIDVGIYRGSTLVRRVWTAKSLVRGTYSYTRNGRTSAGGFVAPGIYRIKVTATSWIGTTWYVRNVVVEAH